MFDIFNRRELKEITALRDKAVILAESLTKTAEQAQNELKVAQEHNKQTLEICRFRK